MLEKNFDFSIQDTKNIEKLVDDDNLQLNHMILPKGDRLPEHYSNSNVYMIIVRGNMSLELDQQGVHQYHAGQIIAIPYHAKMNVVNSDDEILEFFVVKAPNPAEYGRE
nr:cupin domain-containing protein [uncultured Clostridium sp.]